MRRSGVTALAAIGALGCTLPPLRGKVEVGKDSYAVFVGDGPGGSDLYAFNAKTGEVAAITFSPVAERSPALSPDGAAVAFLRLPGRGDSSGRVTVWVLNLLGGGERELALPRAAAAEEPERIGWTRDGAALYVETRQGVWRFPMPPGAPSERVSAAARATADSSFMLLLGSPAFARVEPCEATGDSLCVVAGDSVSVLAPGQDAARWGSDSIAFVREGAIEVRPLGGGRPRIVELRPPRPVTGGIGYFAGKG